MHHIYSYITILFFALVLIACDSEGGGDSDGIDLGVGVGALVDGEPFVATRVLVASLSETSLTIGVLDDEPTQSPQTLVLFVGAQPISTGTYEIGESTPTGLGLVDYGRFGTTESGEFGIVDFEEVPGSGFIAITDISEGRVKGNFSLRVTNSVLEETLSITEGEFDVALNQ